MTRELESLVEHPTTAECKQWGAGQRGESRVSIVEFVEGVSTRRAMEIARTAFEGRDDVEFGPIAAREAETEVAVNLNEKYVPAGDTLLRIEEEAAAAVTIDRLQGKHSITTQPADQFAGSVGD